MVPQVWPFCAIVVVGIDLSSVDAGVAFDDKEGLYHRSAASTGASFARASFSLRCSFPIFIALTEDSVNVFGRSMDRASCLRSR